MKTAEEILKAIENMDNEEKEKLLYELFFKYYNNRNLPRLEVDWND